jgi:hypothetical protein
MLDTEIKLATCRIDCAGDTGTGWLVASDKVLTARHCVVNAIDKSEPISLTFTSQGTSIELKASIIDHDLGFDVCLLSIEKESNISPIPLSENSIISGSQFYSYTYPTEKLSIGHQLEGTISQVFVPPKFGMDVELHINPQAQLESYDGASGAALICEGACLGLLRVSIGNSVGAISIGQIREFLYKNGVLSEERSKDESRSQELASREDFTQEFDAFITSHSGGYIFIEGAHGIGKSTFCTTYKPVEPSLEHFDTYSFTSNRDENNTVQLAQPQEFLNWLNMQVSMFITQEPGRIVKKDYSDLIKEVEILLVRLGEEYTSRGKIGVLFIDGLDELEKIGGETLKQFIGLLPQQVPNGLTLVLSAPSYTLLAAQLGTRLRNEECLSIPALTDGVTRDFCRRELETVRSTPATIRIITDKAQGHPLYLRYLIDLANSGTDDTGLTALPLINGSIRNYYEALWNQLQNDTEAVNLLAIATRLRWGISIEQFTEILNQAEQTVLVSTITRIKHLLLNAHETTIYHSSFSDFLSKKTELREPDVQLRLAEYCEKNRDNRYGLLNVIHHGLKSKGTKKDHIVSLCDQKWVDDCVTEGNKPDVLLNDVNKVLTSATELGSLVETVRILLLSQRLQFRYNTLFAQSADLTANALISLGKSQETLQHVIRYGRLIISIPNALRVALKLIEASNYSNAIELLNIVETSIDEQFELFHTKGGMLIPDFLDTYDLKLQQLILKSKANRNNSSDEITQFQFLCMKNIDAMHLSKQSSKSIQHIMLAYFQSAAMSLANRYIPISSMPKSDKWRMTDFIEPLINTISCYRDNCENFNIIPNHQILAQVFDDVKTLVADNRENSIKIHPAVIDHLITLGAPSSLVSVIKAVENISLAPIEFVAEDNVSIDDSLLHEGMAAWRLKAMVDSNLPCPSLAILSPSDWKEWLSSICKIFAWCDGAARRIKESGNATDLEVVWSELQHKVFDQLRFTLAQRVAWEDSYSIPEGVIPYIYYHLTTLITDIFPNQINYLLSFIEEQFTLQCGLYSEGFRAVLVNVLDKVTNRRLHDETEDKVFSLIKNWRGFVQANLKNRHELVPELLTITPLFVRLNASEEAQRTYKSVLAFSMGPSWYKEDQFGLMITALDSLKTGLSIESDTLSKIAGILDEAAGEMTFQRFVRYAKRDLIGALCKRGDFSSATSYFIQQTHGTSEQLYKEITLGNIDRISPLRGTRFPGGALDEQDSIFCIIKSAILVADWQLCWTLLEIYQFGDSRHLDNYAKTYALLMQQAEEDNDTIILMLKRLRLICETDVEKEKRSEFLSSIKSHLPSNLVTQFESTFGELSNSENVAEMELVQSFSEEKDELSSEQSTRDTLYMPGTFGTTDSIQEAKNALKKAEKHLKRNSNSDAQKEAIAGIVSIQNGGWPIWFNNMDETLQAERILLEATKSSSDLVKLCSPLIQKECHAERWQIANHIIDWIAASARQDEKADLLSLVIEHTEIMVSSVDEEIQSFNFFEDIKEADASSSLIQLIIHAIDHPIWLRQEKAAEMILWLLRTHSQYIPTFAPKAFSMDNSNHPDVLCGVFDQLSSSDSERFWDQLAPNLDFESIKKNCKHVGRLSVLIRIASRAEQRGSDSATQALLVIKECIPIAAEVAGVPKENSIECPSWAKVLGFKWSRLKEAGLVSSELIQRATTVIEEQCSPLSVETCLEIEQLLAEGLRGNANQSGRWEAKVRFAFQVALLPVATSSFFQKIEKIFRSYNPSRLDHMRVTSFNSPSLNWLNQLKNSKSTFEPTDGRKIYLDFYERVWYDGSFKHVRLTAYFYDNNENLPLPSGRFFSTEKPTLDNTSPWDTCANVKGLPAFFGSLTPAIPTSSLMKITRAANSDITRAYWRMGRLKESLNGAPEHEGCYLAINENALQLPLGIKLVWVYELDGKATGTVTYN